MALRPFLASLFFARPFCLARFGVFRPLRWAARALPWTCKPLKRLDLNFTPFVTQSFTWVLPGVLTALWPKRKITPRSLAMGDFNSPPSAAFDSRHDLSQHTTVRRGAPGRGCVSPEAQNRLLQPGKGCYSLPPSTASDSRHDLSQRITVRRGAPGRGCVLSEAQNRPPHPGNGCYYLPPSAAFDSRHDLSQHTTVRRGAPGRVSSLRPWPPSWRPAAPASPPSSASGPPCQK